MSTTTRVRCGNERIRNHSGNAPTIFLCSYGVWGRQTTASTSSSHEGLRSAARRRQVRMCTSGRGVGMLSSSGFAAFFRSTRSKESLLLRNCLNQLCDAVTCQINSGPTALALSVRAFHYPVSSRMYRAFSREGENIAVNLRCSLRKRIY